MSSIAAADVSPQLYSNMLEWSELPRPLLNALEAAGLCRPDVPVVLQPHSGGGSQGEPGGALPQLPSGV